MNGSLFALLQKPPLYQKSEAEFWNDTYISQQMLQAHLDPDFEGASRRKKFIEQSAAWIQEVVPPDKYTNLLDIGCGPGLYAEEFTKEGYQVTGVDFSRRSIDYAIQSAKDAGLAITYLYKNYLSLHLDQKFDFCTLIYCDYGALSTDDRAAVMKTVYEHLKPGGMFLLDAFTKAKFQKFEEGKTWNLCTGNGFWREEAHLEISGSYKYQDCVTLKQTLILTEQETIPYYIWDTYFTKEMLTDEAERAGFRVCTFTEM